MASGVSKQKSLDKFMEQALVPFVHRFPSPAVSEIGVATANPKFSLYFLGYVIPFVDMKYEIFDELQAFRCSGPSHSIKVAMCPIVSIPHSPLLISCEEEMDF